jgi:hypothetical protein
MTPNPGLETFLAKLEGIVTQKYENCIARSNNLTCKAADDQEVGVLNKVIFYTNPHKLTESIEEITKDVRFMFERRGTRMGKNHPSPGKIAGIIVYRLYRSHIIHLAEDCASCVYQCTSKLNYEYAVRCALEYIGIVYLRIPEEIRKELLYSLSLRHVNQETLALVFDTILQYAPSTAAARPRSRLH